MKLSATSKTIAIVATLLTTTTTIGLSAIRAAVTSSPDLPVIGQLLAKADTPLAKQLQGKPVVVDIYASWCPGCKNIAPTLSKLKQQYGTKINSIVFDVSDAKTTKASMKRAAALGLTDFFTSNKAKTATVAIIDPASGRVLKQFQNNAELADYTTALDGSIAKMKKGGAMGGDAMKNGDAMGGGDAMKK